jgi:hypothetical protein
MPLKGKMQEISLVQVELSSNGTILAFGAYLNDGAGMQEVGHVRINQWSGMDRVQRGRDIMVKPLGIVLVLV